MGTLDSHPSDQEKTATEPVLASAVDSDRGTAFDVDVDSERTPATPSVVDVTPGPSAVAENIPVQPVPWMKSLAAKVGIAAMAVLGATTAVTSVNNSRSAATAAEIKPDSTALTAKPYKNLAVPMLGKDGRSFKIVGTYEKDFNLSVVSPENKPITVLVKVSPEGKFEAKGVFESPATQAEFKPTTLEGQEITFVSADKAGEFIKAHPESPKPIIGNATLNTMKGLKPDRVETINR